MAHGAKLAVDKSIPAFNDCILGTILGAFLAQAATPAVQYAWQVPSPGNNPTPRATGVPRR